MSTIQAGGNYTFATALRSGAAYSVTVGTQPAGQTCTVTQGCGTIGAQSITSVAITCTDNAYTVGGEITGLGGASGLVMANGSDTLAVSAGAAGFTMPTAVAYRVGAAGYGILLALERFYAFQTALAGVKEGVSSTA